ncbi:hypothetical protein LEP1GSC050_4008 [Leptospira broomii serovar Hurstbridge str. 5399]|uniref:Uncharacterized protein n=1 Tax=Leptospira broomii serovar Hurstbridge str. 5399 TaxID=1049789 RepID=T0FC33_9LEPT|nr:hypothetical protein LEP1GSC050_4008 [Leptospira broomii serovar Hurstbridge str. 5399]
MKFFAFGMSTFFLGAVEGIFFFSTFYDFLNMTNPDIYFG